MIRPLKDSVVVKEEPWRLEELESGLVISHHSETPTVLIGRVLRVGPGPCTDPTDPKRKYQMPFKPGDRVCYQRGQGMEHDGEVVFKAWQIEHCTLPEGEIHVRRPYDGDENQNY